ncbi:efflux RND transporter periplasmic adaptor subunit [Pedomonas mirosovicensis]|uniref:efflux RND transporter periplasmic adaptor subunit n=1 Tax=Pedomonas mirosovicensis TaxID=2908641 RepID=UPI00216902D4|nr:efflux RND transporter periplasmic adaptor subunit [Pedomonas mirosovicensis]MCH8686590.1 efflux RND transporter periplasmic adaptor subunit [Pedomonas mirosovicensis]
MSRNAGKLALVLMLGTALAGCKTEQTAQNAPAPEVGVIVLKPESAALTSELPGRLTPYMVSDVRPQVGGIIQKRLFEEGSMVKKGQLLYQIDPAPYQAAYDQAVANLARAEATLKSTANRAGRYAELVKINAVSKQDAEDALAARDQAAAEVAAAKAAVQNARINLDYTRVEAPISGRIGRSTFTPGALVTAGQAEALATIQTLDPIYVDVTQSSTEMLQLREAFAQGSLKDGKDATANVDLILPNGARYGHRGTLKFSEVSVDPSSGTVVIRALVPNPDGTLLPGMYVKAVLTEGVDPNAILAPQEAISRDEKGNPVAMLVGKDGKVERRVVKTSRVIGNRWLITGGLAPGERLIVDGFQKIRPGVPVKTVAAAQAGAAPQAGSAPQAASR